jgi:hypothetical protein
MQQPDFEEIRLSLANVRSSTDPSAAIFFCRQRTVCQQISNNTPIDRGLDL